MTDDAPQTVTLTLDDLANLLGLVALPDETGDTLRQALDLARSLDRSGRAGTIVINTTGVPPKDLRP